MIGCATTAAPTSPTRPATAAAEPPAPGEPSERHYADSPLTPCAREVTAIVLAAARGEPAPDSRFTVEAMAIEWAGAPPAELRPLAFLARLDVAVDAGDAERWWKVAVVLDGDGLGVAQVEARPAAAPALAPSEAPDLAEVARLALTRALPTARTSGLGAAFPSLADGAGLPSADVVRVGVDDLAIVVDRPGGRSLLSLRARTDEGLVLGRPLAIETRLAEPPPSGAADPNRGATVGIPVDAHGPRAAADLAVFDHVPGGPGVDPELDPLEAPGALDLGGLVHAEG